MNQQELDKRNEATQHDEIRINKVGRLFYATFKTWQSTNPTMKVETTVQGRTEVEVQRKINAFLEKE